MTDDTEKQFEFERRYNTTLESVVSTLQWLFIALILAFVFRAFIVEPFRIPTGSMAETLRGVHYHLRCTRCGYELDLGGDREIDHSPKCASCGYLVNIKDVPPVLNGDRIFVLKSIYQFHEPKRWDVVVFKYPVDPKQNYIKRLIGKPGETIEIVDGDIYIDGVIARKPPHVQEEFWMSIFNNDYQAAGRAQREARLAIEDMKEDRDHLNFKWGQPFTNREGSAWNFAADGPTAFELNVAADSRHTIYYDTSKGNDFKARYMYNSATYGLHPECSDLMVEYYVVAGSDAGHAGVMLSKYGREYRGWVDFSGELVLEAAIDKGVVRLASKAIDAVGDGDSGKLRFANVDHQLVLEYGDKKIKWDLGVEVGSAGVVEDGQEPAVQVFGSGKMRLAHLAIYRDMYYMGQTSVRAREGKPFALGEDEFFMCGDNSPDSFDSRLWATDGVGNGGRRYRQGIVPREYLVGKAFYVYWGDAFKPFENLLPIIPNFSKMGVIYGGSEREY